MTSKESKRPVAPQLNSWDPTNWTPKRVWNNTLFRSGAILAVVAIAFKFSVESLSQKGGAMVHLISFASWFGTMIYTTFIAGLIMYKELPRQMFGKLQAKLFPQYFNLSTICIVLQILTSPLIERLGDRSLPPALVLSLCLTLVNQFYFGPQSTVVMFRRHDIENSEESHAKESEIYKKLSKEFGMLHGMSSLANLIALCAAIYHGYTLAELML